MFGKNTPKHQYRNMKTPLPSGASRSVFMLEVVGKGQSRPLRNGDEIAVLPAKRLGSDLRGVFGR